MGNVWVLIAAAIVVLWLAGKADAGFHIPDDIPSEDDIVEAKIELSATEPNVFRMHGRWSFWDEAQLPSGAFFDTEAEAIASFKEYCDGL